MADLLSAPLSYLSAAGPAAGPVLFLQWGLIGISVAVVLIITGLLAIAVGRRRGRVADPRSLETKSTGISWIYIGVGASLIPLVAATVWMLMVLHAIREPGGDGALQIEVTGQQFWWSFHYDAEPDGQGGAATAAFTTANELHIPVGRRVHLKVTSADVIHSFWVPKLAGRMDMIPGLVNETWMQADQPGVYRGQCGEFCGLEHAEMAFVVIAEPADQFLAWRRHQLDASHADPAFQAGAALFQRRCGSCHAVRGTAAQAEIAPDLSHIASRQKLASGVLPNNVASMRLWLKNPDAVKPGTPMPNPGLSDQDLDAVVSYLASLK